ncbi:basic proline-rich protein-like [Erinaceus europaeus]|uniref:Basic proline-rich protein-like n=1 Tax=Erinaceus europaeus TaxID=9365 RepID=A0ABM3W0S2_ERIEU|nr:basic proline-rich protein-like [Erinaceus europaeus]
MLGARVPRGGSSHAAPGPRIPRAESAGPLGPTRPGPRPRPRGGKAGRARPAKPRARGPAVTWRRSDNFDPPAPPRLRAGPLRTVPAGPPAAQPAPQTRSLPSSAPPFLTHAPVAPAPPVRAAPAPTRPRRAAPEREDAPSPAPAPRPGDRDGGGGCGGPAAGARGGPPAPPALCARPSRPLRPPPPPPGLDASGPRGCHLEARRAARWRDRGAGRPHLLRAVRLSPGRRRGRHGSGRPQALARLESGGWNPPGALNSRAPRCCVSASSWGLGPGGRSGGLGRAGPSGRRARRPGRAAGWGRTGGAGGRTGRQRGPGSGIRYAARGSPTNSPRAEPPPPSFLLPRPQPISGAPLGWLRQSAAPPSAGPASQSGPRLPLLVSNQSERRVGRPNAGGSTRRPGEACGEWRAWGRGAVPRVAAGAARLGPLLAFSLRPPSLGAYTMVTRPFSPSRSTAPLICVAPAISVPPSLQHPLEKLRAGRRAPTFAGSFCPLGQSSGKDSDKSSGDSPPFLKKGPRLQPRGPGCREAPPVPASPCRLPRLPRLLPGKVAECGALIRFQLTAESLTPTHPLPPPLGHQSSGGGGGDGGRLTARAQLGVPTPVRDQVWTLTWLPPSRQAHTHRRRSPSRGELARSDSGDPDRISCAGDTVKRRCVPLAMES